MSNGDGPNREIYGRIGNLESGLKSLQTELAGYARTTSEAIQRLTHTLALESEKSEERAEAAMQKADSQLQQARTEWSSWRDQSRPNWIGIIAVFISAFVAVGSLYKQSTDAQVRPLTIQTAHNAADIISMRTEHETDLSREVGHLEEKAGLRREANAESHLRLMERISRLELKLDKALCDERVSP